jgi:AAA+ ATPase superfamily predicted ATPase
MGQEECDEGSGEGGLRMPFFNRERELNQLKAVFEGEPNLIYFVLGPINSGKTALLMKVFEELSREYKVFYINFRARHVVEFTDLLKVLFEVKYGRRRKRVSGIVKEFLKAGAKAVERFKGVPVPEKVFDYLFVDSRKVEDVFRYLEEVFEEIGRSGYRPVFVLDEMQVIKEVVNTAGKPVISELFNFMVRMTKEMHLCHCLCATSDCLFVEMVYNNARLEGRVNYVLVDDLGREEAYRVYEGFGFEEKGFMWEYIGGKVGDMVRVYEGKKLGYSEREAVERMLRDEVGRLKWMKARLYREKERGEEIWRFLEAFKEEWEIRVVLEEVFDKLVYLIEENVLFYNPLEGVVRPQGRLIWRAIKEVV